MNKTSLYSGSVGVSHSLLGAPAWSSVLGVLLRAPWAEGRVLQLQHPLLPNPSSSCIRPWHAVCWGASALPGGLAGAARHMLCLPLPPPHLKSQNLEGYHCVQVLIQPSLALLHLIPLLDPGVHAPLTCMSVMPMVGSVFFFFSWV